MIWPTSSARRADSRWRRRAKWVTCRGSSEAASMVSARIPIAPIGVFSSCETFATKSLRTASTRRVAASSSAMTRTNPRPSGSTRVENSTPSMPGGRSWMTFPRYSVFVLRTCRTRSSSPGNPTRVPRASPIIVAWVFTFTTSSWGPTSSPPEGKHSTTAARSSWTGDGSRGAGCGSPVRAGEPRIPATRAAARASRAPIRKATTTAMFQILRSGPAVGGDH